MLQSIGSVMPWPPPPRMKNKANQGIHSVLGIYLLVYSAMYFLSFIFYPKLSYIFNTIIYLYTRDFKLLAFPSYSLPFIPTVLREIIFNKSLERCIYFHWTFSIKRKRNFFSSQSKHLISSLPFSFFNSISSHFYDLFKF